MNHYPVLFWGNLVLNFVTPFFILMRNDTKRKFGTMFFVALIVFFGHWWDFFYMIKPGARTAAHEAMELAEGKHHGSSHETAHAPAAPAAAHHAEEHTAAPATADTAAHAGEAAHAEAGHEAHTPDAAAHEGASHGEGHEAAAGHHGEEADESKSFKFGYTIPGLDDLGVLIGFLSLFLFFFFNQLSKSSLVPLKDPFLDESLHHETGAMIEGEEGGAHH
jgi:hypothetical protein